MRTILQRAQVPDGAPVLLAFLSGTYSDPEDFIREGFPDALRDHGIDAEVVLVEMRAAWFADGSVVQRLREAVVLPAQARGRSRIWFAGISLGALAALSYAARHENDIEGIVLISPYPATREVLREMDEAGGLAAWRPVIPLDGDLEREAWLWLAKHEKYPVVHCYFASGDRFAEGQRRMAQALAPERVRELPGAHDWTAWRSLWKAFLGNSKASLQ